MGSLTNLYISQSYQSLIHLATENTASATFIELQDGLGNGLGVSVNIFGDISASGNIYASNLTGSWDNTSLNQFTASQEQKNFTLESVTQSLEANDTLFTNKFSNIAGQSASWDNTELNAYTASNNTKWDNIGAQSGSWITESETGSFAQASVFNAYTQSNDQKWNNIELQSGSWVTESETGSFARTDITNTFTATQNINGDLNVQGTLNVTNIHTTTETSSIIYSSGSNQFGDASDDVQTLYGSVRVVNELTASGLNYPTVDNGEESFMQTDGNGNLSLKYVKTIYQNIRNREIFDITKGTPLFVSGSTGDNADVYVADAGNPLRMPATLIAGDATLAAGATGKGIILGHIEGVDTNAYPAGTEVYVAVGGGWTDVKPTGSTIPVQPLGVVTRQSNNGMGIVLTQVPFDLPNLATGNVWVGDGNNQPVIVATSSFGTTINTGSFATTGSNLFRGIQTLEDPAQNITALVPTSGALMLVAESFNSSSAHISASATTFTNLIFKNNNNAADTIISGSNNIIGNSIVTANFKRYVGANNIALSGFVPQMSASMAFPITITTNYFGNPNATPMSMRGPVSSSTWTIQGNAILGALNFGASAALNGERIKSGMAINNNVINGTMNWNATRTDFDSPIFVANSNLGGALVGNFNSSSFAFLGSVFQGSGTITNNAYNAASIPNGSNGFGILQSAILGSTNTINVSGSTTNTNPVLHYNKQMQGSAIIGANNFISLERTDVSSSVGMLGVVVIGAGLTVTGSNEMSSSANTANQGAVFVGRFNSNVGTQANSGETVFAVGTGTPSARRTGFLIDSGSNAIISGSLAISGGFNADLQQGYVWVGDANNRLTTVATSSFGGGGGGGFPYSGDAQISGSLGVTGSFSGFVNSISIASSTASIDMSKGNFFTLSLPSSGTTHITATNIKAGQTLNLKVVQNGTTATEVAFSPNIKFAGGYDYQATPNTGAVDLLSFVTFDTSEILATSVKNLL